jgi:hypothetical protein
LICFALSNRIVGTSQNDCAFSAASKTIPCRSASIRSSHRPKERWPFSVFFEKQIIKANFRQSAMVRCCPCEANFLALSAVQHQIDIIKMRPYNRRAHREFFA